MPNTALVTGAGTVVFALGAAAAFPSRRHSRRTDVNREPLAHGGSLADHASSRPRELTLSGTVTDSGGAAAVAAVYAAADFLQDGSVPVAVYTEWAVYSEMVVKRLDASPRGRGMRLTLELVELERAPPPPPPPLDPELERIRAGAYDLYDSYRLFPGAPTSLRDPTRAGIDPSGGGGTYAAYAHQAAVAQADRVAADRARRDDPRSASSRAGIRQNLRFQVERRGAAALAERDAREAATSSVVLRRAPEGDRRAYRQFVERHGREAANREFAPRYVPAADRSTYVTRGQVPIVSSAARADAAQGSSGDDLRVRWDGRR